MGDAYPLHVEFRFSDGHWIPSVAAALPCLLYALLLKAVDISRYGMLLVGSKEEIKRRHEVRTCLLNNNGNWRSLRISYTAGIEEYFDELREQSHEMLRLTKGVLEKLGSSYQVLLQLADFPISVMRSSGSSWEEIKLVFEKIHKRTQRKHPFEDKILQVIDLASCEADSKDEWVTDVADYLGISEDNVRGFISRMQHEGQINWSSKLRTFERS